MELLENALKSFFEVILAGESKTYNDHNWYTPNGLKGYIEGSSKSPYPLFNKPLSDYTVGEIIAFQSRNRDANGQLWATGRYQIIPNTLKSLISSAGVSKNDKYDKKTQDKLGLQLLKNRNAIKSYIYGYVPDNNDTLNKAITETAMTWSSVGVPQDMKGSKKKIKKGESYYSGGGDKASVNPDDVGIALKKLRSILTGTIDVVKKNPVSTILITTAIVFGLYVLITQKRI